MPKNVSCYWKLKLELENVTISYAGTCARYVPTVRLPCVSIKREWRRCGGGTHVKWFLRARITYPLVIGGGGGVFRFGSGADGKCRAESELQVQRLIVRLFYEDLHLVVANGRGSVRGDGRGGLEKSNRRM